MPNSRMADVGQSNLQRRSCGIVRITALWVLCRYRHKTHASGAKHRLNRDFSGRFGSEAYAREELVAEMGSAFLCASLGIVPTVRHADYVANWLAIWRGEHMANNREVAIMRRNATARAQRPVTAIHSSALF
jgi:antirestriction protein ArdC